MALAGLARAVDFTGDALGLGDPQTMPLRLLGCVHALSSLLALIFIDRRLRAHPGAPGPRLAGCADPGSSSFQYAVPVQLLHRVRCAAQCLAGAGAAVGVVARRPRATQSRVAAVGPVPCRAGAVAVSACGDPLVVLAAGPVGAGACIGLVLAATGTGAAVAAAAGAGVAIRRAEAVSDHRRRQSLEQFLRRGAAGGRRSACLCPRSGSAGCLRRTGPHHLVSATWPRCARRMSASLRVVAGALVGKACARTGGLGAPGRARGLSLSGQWRPGYLGELAGGQFQRMPPGPLWLGGSISDGIVCLPYNALLAFWAAPSLLLVGLTARRRSPAAARIGRATSGDPAHRRCTGRRCGDGPCCC